MMLQMRRGKLNDPGDSRLFFLICWTAYFTTYLGRLNYSACLSEISAAEGWTKSQSGLIATGFFITYGLGQLVSGIVGDRISPRLMVGTGLGLSGVLNLLFPLMGSPGAATVLWCLNGFVQSMIWSPLVRILSEWMPEEKRIRACVNMSSTVPAGTLAVYGLSSAVIWLSGWKPVFWISGVLVLGASFLWFRVIGRLENRLERPVFLTPDQIPRQEIRSVPLSRLILMAAIPLCGAALLMQGMLKDGITTWIPTFLTEQFHLPSAAAILSTTVVPIVNLGGVYLASWLNGRVFKNELGTAGVFFLAAAAGLLVLFLAAGGSAVGSLSLLALSTTCMMGVNTLLVGLVPTYFVGYGKCSTMSGILNTAAYIGCALSAYLSGALAQHFSWNAVMICWCVCAGAGFLFCLFSFRRWKNFRSQC